MNFRELIEKNENRLNVIVLRAGQDRYKDWAEYPDILSMYLEVPSREEAEKAMEDKFYQAFKLLKDVKMDFTKDDGVAILTKTKVVDGLAIAFSWGMPKAAKKHIKDVYVKASARADFDAEEMRKRFENKLK